MRNKYLTCFFAKVYILKYGTTEKTIKSELFSPFQLNEKMLQKISTGAGRCRRGGMVGKGSGFPRAFTGFLSA